MAATVAGRVALDIIIEQTSWTQSRALLLATLRETADGPKTLEIMTRHIAGALLMVAANKKPTPDESCPACVERFERLGADILAGVR